MTDKDFDEIVTRLELMTDEESELYGRRRQIELLKFELQSLAKTAAAIRSKVWTPEAQKYAEFVVDGSAAAVRSLDDELKIATLKIKAYEANV